MERKLNKEKYKTLQQKEQAKDTELGGNIPVSVNFNTVIHLPRPAYQISGSCAKLSAD